MLTQYQLISSILFITITILTFALYKIYSLQDKIREIQAIAKVLDFKVERNQQHILKADKYIFATNNKLDYKLQVLAGLIYKQSNMAKYTDKQKSLLVDFLPQSQQPVYP